MNTQEIVQKLWNLCNVLRDDGITYHQYVSELTYILFLKMMKETEQEKLIPEGYRWDDLVDKDGVELMRFYRQLLLDLGTTGNAKVKQIYANASTNITAPANLKNIVSSINNLDWFSAKEEGLGDLYEGLLEKNANEKKSGAGQYFTPRPLINVMVKLIDPQPGERCNDPAGGTFGFMISADQYVRSKTGDYYDLGEREASFQRKEAFSGCELVQDTHRLALMNAMLHGIEGEILLGDSLSNLGKTMGNMDVILTNPPFGTKKGGERPTRDDLTFATSNKQLNFLQHIYRALKPNGKARAAVVLPDNVLFQDGDGQKIRADLMDKCNLHTILRLPTGIFYAQGIKTNVLFFTRGETDKGNTKEVWFYDLRTNMSKFGKRNPLTEDHFKSFVEAYTAKDRYQISDERWSVLTREQIRNLDDNLDHGLIADESSSIYDNLPDPLEYIDEVVEKLQRTTIILQEVSNNLKTSSDNNIILVEEALENNKALMTLLEAATVSEDDFPYDLPEKWVWVELGNIAKFINGDRGNNYPSQKDFIKSGIPFINAGHLKNGKIDIAKMNYISKEKFEALGSGKVMEDDVLYCLRGTLGKAAIVSNIDEGAIASSLVILRPHKGIVSKYIYYYLISSIGMSMINIHDNGSAQPNLSAGNVKKYLVPIPSYYEQRRIVSRLEATFNRIDNARRIIGDLKEFEILKHSALYKAFRGELFDLVFND